MKINKFGSIVELNSGVLQFSDFNINAEGFHGPSDELLLIAVIERLNAELTTLRQRTNVFGCTFANTPEIGIRLDAP